MSDAINDALDALNRLKAEQANPAAVSVLESVVKASLGANGGEAGDEYDALRDFGNWMEWSAGQPGNTESFADFCRNAAGHARSFARMREEARDIHGNPVYPKSMGAKRPAPPSVAVPEGFDVRRNSEGDIIVTRLSDGGAAAYSKDSPMVTVVMGWHFLDAMLAAAPQPDHSADAGKVATIQLDPRYQEPRPLITNAMKADHIGEYQFTVDTTDAFGNEVTEQFTVPWDTCKAIYKGMAKTAMRSCHATLSVPEEEVRQLEEIRSLIEGAPIDALGTGTANNCEPWPIRDEVIYNISRVIDSLRTAGDDGEGV